MIKTPKQKVLLEFKYLTQNSEHEIDGMRQIVKSQGAYPNRSYDCWKDIERIEGFSNFKQTDIYYGYFILVTNDSRLWNGPVRDAQYVNFRIDEGLHKSGKRMWNQDPPPKGVGKNRTRALRINNNYNFEYKDFSNFEERNGLFKSLVVEIN